MFTLVGDEGGIVVSVLDWCRKGHGMCVAPAIVLGRHERGGMVVSFDLHLPRWTPRQKLLQNTNQRLSHYKTSLNIEWLFTTHGHNAAATRSPAIGSGNDGY